MRTPRPLSWPQERHELALKAALLDQEPARDAWVRLQRAGGVEPLDGGLYRLLPMLQRNLTAMGLRHADEKRWRGIHRMTWARTRVKLAKTAQVIDGLRAGGVTDVMVLKGTPLALEFYPDLGLRPMDDVDILVRERDRHQAIAVLGQLGWSRSGPAGRLSHAVTLADRDGAQLDLHWRFLRAHDPADNDAMWARAKVVRIEHSAAFRPSGPDLLFHVLTHGSGYNDVAPIRWAADATMLLRRESPTVADWHLIVRRAIDRGVVLPLLETLEFLALEIGCEVPATVRDELRHAPLRWLDRVEHALWWAPADERFATDALVRLIEQVRRDGRARWSHLFATCDHFREYWGLGGWHELPGAVARRAVTQLPALGRAASTLLGGGAPRVTTRSAARAR